MSRSLLRRAAAGLAVSLLAGACGAAGGVVHTLAAVPTKSQISSALHAVGGLSGVNVTLRLDATTAQIQQADPTVAAQDAALLLGSNIQVVVENTSGAPLSALKDNPGAARFEFSVNVPVNGTATPVVDLREVARVLYAQVDVASIMSIAHSHTDLTPVESQFPPTSPLGFVSDLLKGKWVSLDLNQLKGAASGLGNSNPQLKALLGQLATTSATQPSQSTAARIRSAIGSAFDRDVTVTKGAPSGALGTEFTVSAPGRKLVGDLVNSFSGVLPPVLQTQLPKVAAGVPDRIYSAQVFVKDGVLRAVKLDLSQFDKKLAAVGPFYLEVDITPTSAPISAPPSSTAINVKAALGALMQMIGSQMAGGSRSSTSSNSSNPFGM